jgi:hypothetical protein
MKIRNELFSLASLDFMTYWALKIGRREIVELSKQIIEYYELPDNDTIILLN